MAEGIENLDNFDETEISISFEGEAADSLKSMAILETTTPAEITRMALAFLDKHLQLEREGYKGPFYNKDGVIELLKFHFE